MEQQMYSDKWLQVMCEELVRLKDSFDTLEERLGRVEEKVGIVV